MFYLTLLIGAFLGSIIFTFTFITAKRNGKFYLAPVITFLMSIGITAYGLFFVGGFEGMAYGFLALGFLFVSIIGTLLLPLFLRKGTSRQFKRIDKISLVILPLLFFLTIGGVFYSDKGYWIIQEGGTFGEEEGYRVSTISEGKKEVLIVLGNEYVGKEVKVKKVSRRGPTEIVLEVIEGDNKDQAPYIRIGLDEIREPLQVQTADGTIFDSITVKGNN